MTKQEFLAMSLSKELILQSPYGFRPNGKESTGFFRLVYLTGDLYADIENKTFPEEFIPILRPLSDLTKEIEHKGKVFKPSFALSRDFKNAEDFIYLIIQILNGEEEMKLIEVMKYCPLNIVQKLIEWHFDLADLISKEEAIDVNTLEETPYK